MAGQLTAIKTTVTDPMHALPWRRIVSRPTASVIIVNWNTGDLTCRAIESVPERTGGKAVEVIVVDNASTDGSAGLISAQFPNVRLVCNAANVGFGAANNLGFEHAAGKYVLLLNSDAELQPGALEALAADLDAHGDAGAVGARLVNPDGSFQSSFADFPVLWQDGIVLLGLRQAVLGRSYPSYTEGESRYGREVDWVGGACMMLRMEAVRAVGGFDAGYYMYSEEMDLCQRIHDSGFTVRYQPRAVAKHHGGRSMDRRLPEQAYLLWRSRLRYYRLHCSPWQSVVLRVWIRVAYRVRQAMWMLFLATMKGPVGRSAAARAESAKMIAGRL